MIKRTRRAVYHVLRTIERHVKTDMVYLAKGSFWLTLSQVISSLSALALAIVFAHFISKEVYGTYKYILAVVGILTIPTLTGMNTAVTQAAARGFDGSYRVALRSSIRWGMLGGIASLLLAAYYFVNGNNALASSFGVAAFFIPIMDPLTTYQALLSGKKLFKEATYYGIVTKIGATAALIISLFFFKTALLITAAYFVFNTLLRFISTQWALYKLERNTKIDPETISYGKHLSAMNIIAIIASQIDKVIIFHLLGVTDLAIYSFATLPTEQLKGVLKNINSLAFPKFSEKSVSTIKKTIYQKMVLLSSLLILATVVYIGIAPFAFKLIFPQYLDAVPYSQLFMISIVSSPASLAVIALQSQKAKKQLYSFNTYTSIVQIALLVVCTYGYGLWGAIWARILSRYINAALSLYLFKKFSDESS